MEAGRSKRLAIFSAQKSEALQDAPDMEAQAEVFKAMEPFKPFQCCRIEAEPAGLLFLGGGLSKSGLNPDKGAPWLISSTKLPMEQALKWPLRASRIFQTWFAWFA